MPTTSVVVRVIRSGLQVEAAIRRPVRLTPDGLAGVVFDGAVYPLRADNSIDLTDRAWEMEDARRFLLSGVPVPYAPGGTATTPSPLGVYVDWTVEPAGTGYYLLFDAPERLGVQIIDRLTSTGLSVQRWDVSHRLASDGKYYDWFARLLTDATIEQLCSTIEAALQSPAPEVEVRAVGAPDVAQLQARIEAQASEIAGLHELIAVAERESVAGTAALADERRGAERLRADLARSAALYADLRLDYEQLRDMSTQPPPPTDESLEREQLVEMALAENAELWGQVRQLESEVNGFDNDLAVARAEVEQLTARLEELGESERRRRRELRPASGPLPGVAGFLDRSFQRLEFVLDSLDILEDFNSPAAALRVLFEIDRGDIVGKDLEGIRGWREVSKIATGNPGQEDLGRIYYLLGGPRVLVSIHIKQDEKQQQRHIARLARLV